MAISRTCLRQASRPRWTNVLGDTELLREVTRMSRMIERLEKGQLSTGMFALATGPEYMEIMGHVGIDFLIVDLMTTSMNWETVANMVRSARIYDVTPFVRLQAFPWNGSFDPRAASDAMRALSTGAQGILISVDTPEMIASVLPVAEEWHAQSYLL